jgi:choice-of-anchor B domain-containing protein
MQASRLTFISSFFFLLIEICAQDCTQLELNLIINTGDWAEEYSWSVTDEQGALIDTSSITYLNYSEYSESICLEQGCYTYNLYDSYGDGWQGGSYSIVTNTEMLISSGSMDGSYYSSSQNFCVQQAMFETCQFNSLTVTIETGSFAEQLSWSIHDSIGVLVDSLYAYYYVSEYIDYNTYQHEVCLDDGCYYFNMYDSYGDGWQGGNFTISTEQSIIIASGDLPLGLYEDLFFSVNGDCNLVVCTDENSDNYNEVSTLGSDCIYTSEHTSLFGQWADESLPINGLAGSYSDVYGYEKDGREFAIIGSTNGTHIIDINETGNLFEIAFIQGAYSGSGVTHRDYHIIGDYLYAVCDQGSSTLQIIDLTNLPESVEVVYDSDELFSRTHNIFIDTVSQKLYSCSTKGYDESNNYWTSSLCVYDISNPIQPVFLHNMNEYIPNTHDIWVDSDTAFINCPGTGTLIWEFDGQPSQISSFTSYPDFGTNHSGWKSGHTYVFAEENSGYDVKVVDASDVSNLELLSTLNSNVNEFSIAHNLMIKDDLVYISYYQDGLQVFDISNPMNPIQVAYYDTYMPTNYGGYAGAWGVYAFLPSRRVLISDVQSGLFVLEMNLAEQQTIQLNSGWNMVSTYLYNNELTATLFMEENTDNTIIMKNNLGESYLPLWDYDGIGYMEYGQGYQVKVYEDATLWVHGAKLYTPLILNQGWNMIAVLSQTSQPIQEVLSSCTELVIVAKNSLGVAYLPQWEFDGIGLMIPGLGYQIKMESESEITFEE